MASRRHIGMPRCQQSSQQRRFTRTRTRTRTRTEKPAASTDPRDGEDCELLQPRAGGRKRKGWRGEGGLGRERFLQSPTNPNVYYASALQFTHVAGYDAQMVVGRKRALRWHLISRKVSVYVHGARSCSHRAYGHEHLDGTFDTYTF